MRPTDNDVVDPFETSFLESHRLDIAAFCKHGDHVVEPDAPFEPIRIAYTWLAVFRQQFIILSPTPSPKRKPNISQRFRIDACNAQTEK